jgi:hypothetical protein
MRATLKPHPDSPCAAVARIDVEVWRPRPGALVLCYVVTGETSGLRMPPAAASARADGLWRHTCLEAFVRASPDTGYYELNFSPSTQWAAYGFGGYRSGMRVAREIGAPRFEVDSSPESYRLRVSLDLVRLPGLPSGGAWRVGLSAVIEETGGRQSYWALAHPPGRADFHHLDCFALELPAACHP